MTLDSECWSGSSVLIRGGIGIAGRLAPLVVPMWAAFVPAPPMDPPNTGVAGLVRFDGDAASGVFGTEW